MWEGESEQSEEGFEEVADKTPAELVQEGGFELVGSTAGGAPLAVPPMLQEVPDMAEKGFVFQK